MTNNKTDYNKLLFDPQFRNDIRNNPAKYVTLLGYDSTGKEGIEYVVKTNTKKVLYISILETAYFKDEDTLRLQAAGTTGTAGTAGTVGSMGSICSSVGTILTVGSVGSAGTADV